MTTVPCTMRTYSIRRRDKIPRLNRLINSVTFRFTTPPGSISGTRGSRLSQPAHEPHFCRDRTSETIVGRGSTRLNSPIQLNILTGSSRVCFRQDVTMKINIGGYSQWIPFHHSMRGLGERKSRPPVPRAHRRTQLRRHLIGCKTAEPGVITSQIITRTKFAITHRTSTCRADVRRPMQILNVLGSKHQKLDVHYNIDWPP